MRDIMEMARQLGAEIKEDERIKTLEKARAAYESDKALQNAILEYNTQQAALAEEYKKPERDQEIIAAIEARIHTLYETITGNASYIAIDAAQDAVNAFMNEVNGEITFAITGERPCTHDCSSCGGSCGHEH